MSERELAAATDGKPNQPPEATALYEAARPSVANVVASHFYHGKQVMGSAGSGFFVKSPSDTGLPRCEMVTDNHVVSIDPRLNVQLEVELNDGSKHKASIINEDKSHDLALLKVEDVNDPENTCKALTISEQALAPGESSMRINRSHDGPDFYTGNLVGKAIRRDLELPELSGEDMNRELMVFDTYNNIGHQFSGAPYINSKGEILAIHEGGQGTQQSVATPSKNIADLLEATHKQSRDR